MTNIQNIEEFKICMKYLKRFLKEHGLLKQYYNITMSYYNFDIEKYFKICKFHNTPFETYFRYVHYLGEEYYKYNSYNIEGRELIPYMADEFNKRLHDKPLYYIIEKYRNERK